jgi:heme exporter protein D
MADATWVAIYIATAAVVVAIAVPQWQRHTMLKDAKESERRAVDRFIEAFRALAVAQDAVVAASRLDKSTEAFALAELELMGAMEALSGSATTTLPVVAIVNSVKAQLKASATLAHFPDLKLYGSNLLTYGTLKDRLEQTRNETYALLRPVEALAEARTIAAKIKR